jgi:CO dehydrogenase/acetyl-CoA synthase beta subunit
MRIEVSKGELIDKITILEIKDDRVKDEEKLKNIRHELDVLLKYEFETPLKERLKVVNNSLWDESDFGEKFIKLARNIYKFNDERARIKKLINIEQGSDIVEEKSY